MRTSLCCFVFLSCGVVPLFIWMHLTLTHHSIRNGLTEKRFVISEKSRSIEDIIQERNEERRQRMKTMCGPNECLNGKGLTNIIVDDRHKVMFCYVPKVACTQWKTVFASLKGYFPISGISIHYAPKGTFKYLQSYPVEERSKMLRDYYKFLFVREPMERLLSAYKDKFSEFAKDQTFKKGWSKHVLQFVKNQNAPRKDNNISFEDFLGFVGSEKVWQEHWELSYKLCQPCAIDYDFIGHFENLEDEAPYVLKASGLNNTVPFPAYRPSNTTSELLRFYSKIPKNLIVEVANLFKTDFELFGYAFPGQLKGILKDFILPTKKSERPSHLQVQNANSVDLYE